MKQYHVRRLPRLLLLNGGCEKAVSLRKYGFNSRFSDIYVTSRYTIYVIDCKAKYLSEWCSFSVGDIV